MAEDSLSLNVLDELFHTLKHKSLKLQKIKILNWERPHWINKKHTKIPVDK